MTLSTTTHVRPRPWTTWRVAALALAVLALVAGLTLFSTRAFAAFTALAENGTAGHLTLKEDPSPAQFMDMSPGSLAQWEIEADLADLSSPLTVQFKRDGDLASRPDGLWVQVQRCDQAWSSFPAAPVCATGATMVMTNTAASDTATLGAMTPNSGTLPPDAPVMPAGTITNTQSQFILVTMSIPDSPEARADKSLQGLTATLGFGLTASGADTPVTPPPTTPVLAHTGLDIAAILLIAFGALAIGLLVRGAARIRQQADERIGA